MIKVLGKQTFHSPKKNQDYFILHCFFKKDGVEGYASDQKFVSPEIYHKAVLNGSYEIKYGAYDNGRAYILDLIEVPQS